METRKFLFVPVLVLFAAGPLFATQTENHGIHAVPAPGKVTIDGKLDDWDLSGQTLMCYDIENLRDVYSAQVAMMYDADALYVGIHWKDPKPMVNIHEPHYQGGKGWAGDSVQLRFKTDRIAHVTAWYYTARQEPTLQVEYGKSLTEPFGGGGIQLYRTAGWKLTEGAEMAFLKDPDGKGYVQEMKLPWTLLVKEHAYKPGESFQCGVELLWGSGDFPEERYADNLMPGKTSREFFWTAQDAWGPVFLEPKGHLHLPIPDYLVRALKPQTAAPGPVALTYSLPRDARVTLAIEDASGNRVRTLVPALPRTKGTHTEHWDGLDDDGKVVLPGEYRARILYHDPIHTKWALSFNSPGNPSWATSDGRGAFYGDHSAPHAVAAAGNGVALACPIGEGGPPLIGCDLTGQKLWGQANRQAFAGGIQSLATDGKTLWVAAEDTKSYIYRVELATGLYSPWSQVAKDERGNEYKVLDLPVGGLPGPGTGGAGANLRAIAWRGGVLAVCLANEDKILLLDSESGAVKGELTIARPLSAVFDTDGSLIVLSKGNLVRVATDGKQSPFNDGQFPDAQSLAIDATRQVYLSVRGADQDVQVFSPDGKLVREIGKPGGRPSYGPYDENGMLNPAQIAVDNLGRLWVTEENDNPKRTSVWSADGRLVKDLPGSGHYSAAGSLNPYDPTMAFSDDTVFKLDWAAGTSRPVYSLHKRDDPADLFPPHVQEQTSRVVKHGDDTLVYTTSSANGSLEVECTQFHAGEWRSAAHTGMVVRRADDRFAKYMNPLFEGHDGEAYAWADKNGDGLVQADELQFAKIVIDGKPARLQSYYWGQLPGPDGTIPYISRDAGAVIQLPITGYTASGAPIYDVANPHIIHVSGGLLGKGNGEGMTMGGSDGRVYLNQDPILSVDGTGKVLGSYPSHFTSVHGSHEARAAHPGYVIGPSSIAGTADFGKEEVFDLNGNLGEHYLFTSDGMLVQTLFKDVRGGFETPEKAVRGESFDESTAGGESFGANLVRTVDGKVYLTIGGTDARVLELTGLDTLARLPDTTFAYTPTQYEAAQKLAQENAARAAAPHSYVIARAKTAETAWLVDGHASSDWPDLMDNGKPLLEIQDDPDHRYARVEARYDKDNLYLAYRVFAPRNAMRNTGQDEKLLFKSGDVVDLMLGPADASASFPNERLLLTMMGGKPTAILYQKTVPGTPAANRVPFAAPWHSITFDRVVRLPEVKMASGPIEGGYFVEAAVPWSALGVTPRPGLKLKGDVGALFGDGGSVTVARQYWSNKATGLVNDIPGEADLTPTLWGAFELE